MPKHRFALVACARWEETEIQEWVEYHKSIGFNHIYLYSNDDDPTALFQAIAPYAYGSDPFVTFCYWPAVGEQIEIYLHFLQTFKHETQWFAFLDIDEFFVLRGVDDIATFMQGYEAGVDCLYFNWVIHGHSGRLQREAAATLTTYLRRAAEPDVHTKMLCRAASFDAGMVRRGLDAGRGAFWHFLDNYRLPGVRCRDVLYGSTEGYSADFPSSAAPFVSREGFAEAVLDRGYVAHFQFKSEEDFLRRWHRGGFTNGDQWRAAYETGVHHSILAKNNVVYDTYLAEYWHRYTAAAMRFGQRPPYIPLPYDNVALNKPAWQSSVAEPDGQEPPNSRVSGGGNNGVRTGTYGFRTRHETQPWWIVDLLGLHRVAEVHVYNPRFETEPGDTPPDDTPPDDAAPGDLAPASPVTDLDVLASDDGSAWITLLSHTAAEPFGFDGTPLVIFGPPATPLRFIMLRLRSVGCLYLDEVEVYGYPAQAPADPVAATSGPVVVNH